MRKIFSLRREKDKRRSWTGAPVTPAEGGRHDDAVESLREVAEEDAPLALALALASDTRVSMLEPRAPPGALPGATAAAVTMSPPLPLPRLLASLVRPEYDHRLIKNSWLNVIVNCHSSDIHEQALRLFRAELKGSHLYLYKLLPLLSHIRSFKHDDGAADGSPGLYGGNNNSNTTLLDTALVDDRPDDALEVTPPAAALHAPAAAPDDADYTITHWRVTPHPQLAYDAATLLLLPQLSVESLIHFLLFLDADAAVDRLLEVVPVLPRFDRIMHLVNAFVAAVVPGRIEPASDVDGRRVAARVVALLQNVHDNYGGYLLNSEIGPSILTVLESLHELQDKIAAATGSDTLAVPQLKTVMLAKQQSLIDLITHHATDAQPLATLSSHNFLTGVNMIELAQTVCSLDLKFFRRWNSSIDKSLLLHADTLDFFIKKNPLIFNNDTHIHYLARLLVHHLFLENYSSLTASAILERKARVLEKWIDLGCLLDKMGNMLSWLGIASIVLSQPVLRMTRVWLLVSPDYIKLLRNDWLPVLFELDRRYLTNGVKGTAADAKRDSEKDSFHIMAPRGLGKMYYKANVVPYFGDLSIAAATSPNVNELDVVLKKISHSFERWNEYLNNLSNYPEIIHYNNDVLRRYDSMSFIFSNESLNQVLYLGVNDDSAKAQPPALPLHGDAELEPRPVAVNEELWSNLVKLIDINCKLINLATVMEMSLASEQSLPEGYIYQWQQLHANGGLGRKLATNGSEISLDSSDLLPSEPRDATLKVDNPLSKIPLFNNHYFKIDLAKYDELTITEGAPPPPATKNVVVVDDELVFRTDDFVTEVETSRVSSAHFDEIDAVDMEDDVPGLGIDVDDILNSDRFNAIAGEKPAASLRLTRELSGIVSDASAAEAKYLPKYASIDRLIDLLLIDSQHFADGVKMDLNEYRFIFLLNYDSFISTRELLDKLAHRFINSGNAVIAIMKKQHYDHVGKPFTTAHFVNWDIDDAVDLTELGEVDYELLIKIQINILKVLIVMLNNFYANFATDLNNRSMLVKLLKLYSNEILQWYNSNKINNHLEASFESLVNYYKRLKKLFIKKLYRPIELSKFDEYLINDFRFNNSLHEVPINRNLPGHKNLNKIEKFLHKFNKLLVVFYRGIRVEDWLKVFKVLECQYESTSGCGLMEFMLQRNLVTDDNLVILNVFSYMELLTGSDRALVLKRFPLIFRKMFKLYYKFKVYLLIQLADLSITVDERLDRMKTLLIMVHMSKLKMKDHQFVWEGKQLGADIPSCIELAITNVIYSPESRSFTNLWIKAANALNQGTAERFDDLEALLPRRIVASDLAISEPLLPCFGWIIENFLEVNKIPNFYRSTDIINFNKKYLIYRVIKEFGIEDIDNEGRGISPHDTREFEFLLKLDETLVRKQSIRDFNILEKDKLKLFKTVLREQRNILVIDNKKRMQLQALAMALAAPSLGATTSTVLTAGMGDSAGSSVSLTTTNTAATTLPGLLNKKNSSSSLRRQSLSYKSSSTSRFKILGLFNKSRPFLLNVAGLTSSSPDKQVMVRDLPLPESQVDPKQKPYLIIPMKNKKIFPVYLLPLCFKIDSDNSNEDYFIQAMNEFDLNDWLMRLSYANRHWFFSKNLNLKVSNNNITFGIPIATICARERSQSPLVLASLFAEIEDEGIHDVGIYRISTSISELNQVKLIIDKAGTIDFSERTWDVHTLTSVVKSFFRELPDALLSDDVIERFFALRLEGDADLEAYKEILRRLPECNYRTLKALIRHLQRLSVHSDHNRMNSTNLATVIGPALTEASSLDHLINNFGFMNGILEKMISNYSVIFDEPAEELRCGEACGEVGAELKEREATPLTESPEPAEPAPAKPAPAEPSPTEPSPTEPTPKEPSPMEPSPESAESPAPASPAPVAVETR